MSPRLLSKRALQRDYDRLARSLLVARAELRVARRWRSILASPSALSEVRERERVRVDGQPARFIAAWSVTRGYSGMTQALDEDGQVWERCGANAPGNGWWEPVNMERKEQGTYQRPQPVRAADALGGTDAGTSKRRRPRGAA